MTLQELKESVAEKNPPDSIYRNTISLGQAAQECAIRVRPAALEEIDQAHPIEGLADGHVVGQGLRHLYCVGRGR